MQPIQIQKDKLELIEWISRLDNPSLIEKLKEIMISEENDGFSLSDEQKLMLEEGAAKYLAGEEKSFSWNDIKDSAAQLKKLINEKKA